jgi:hypothetical protein
MKAMPSAALMNELNQNERFAVSKEMEHRTIAISRKISEVSNLICLASRGIRFSFQFLCF